MPGARSLTRGAGGGRSERAAALKSNIHHHQQSISDMRKRHFLLLLLPMCARLFKGKAVLGQEFTVTGNKTALPALVEALVGKVQGLIK